MKLITLNVWGGKLWPKLSQFLSKYSSTDIFCFQEVNRGNKFAQDGEVSDLYRKISKTLSDHKGYFHPQVEGIGLATFVKNTRSVYSAEAKTILSQEEMSGIETSDDWEFYPRIAQIIEIDDSQLTICNFHGIPGAKKEDISERDLQAKKLANVLHEVEPKILAGDFNVNPDTRCMSKIEDGLVNFIKENNVKTTRSSYYENKDKIPFADYILASSDVDVSDFEVMQEEVSDHLPLRLKFNVAAH